MPRLNNPPDEIWVEAWQIKEHDMVVFTVGGVQKGLRIVWTDRGTEDVVRLYGKMGQEEALIPLPADTELQIYRPRM